MKRPLRLYIDTSVWNFALELSRSDSILTQDFFYLSSSENYQLFISEVIDAEISRAHLSRKEELQRLLRIYEPISLEVNEEAKFLANTYVSEKLIPENQYNDAVHIAIATVNKCNFIVSWNFKHIVKAKVIMGVHHVNHREGYGLIEIVSPEQFLGRRGVE